MHRLIPSFLPSCMYACNPLLEFPPLPSPPLLATQDSSLEMQKHTTCICRDLIILCYSGYHSFLGTVPWLLVLSPSLERGPLVELKPQLVVALRSSPAPAPATKTHHPSFLLSPFLSSPLLLREIRITLIICGKIPFRLILHLLRF
jgi:hypothetical protein